MINLRKLTEQEKGHCIWKKQGINMIGLIANLAMNVLRKIAFDKCSPEDWITITLFLILMAWFVKIAVNVSAAE